MKDLSGEIKNSQAETMEFWLEEVSKLNTVMKDLVPNHAAPIQVQEWRKPGDMFSKFSLLEENKSTIISANTLSFK